MEQINGKQKPSSDDYFRVTTAASVLASQACTVSAKHIHDGMLRIQFNREVAYYARGIVRDVAEGRKSADWGLKELKKNIKDIVEQSQQVAKYAIGFTAGTVQVIEGSKYCGSVVACPYGTIVVAHGFNNMYENGVNLRDGKSDTQGPVRILYKDISKKLGYGEFEGNMAYAGVDIFTSVYGSARLMLKLEARRLFRYIR
ncbi:DUF4225 domain-containing protein [Pseudomonas sp. 10B1]|uniref:DUF4225 domain-containing protein n=1 Tax=unclassified Pseudomonas TaxID=196821 RepID=UPI002B2361D4|nr:MULTISPECIES: DUF4225 domain-containing protein [unclassified Pseudomonas]MEA9977679.1 DUF4225 domain-containing protein [Pseudomonas sp. RTS4]MEA9996688.1 DUF4225 domain-containing protein [Pseudomonas sp. AA4]MEB0087738.1 DUF4225 domain-containing protein [Pseudomonas sp. RTI1]MEB0124860.1 DUF4225 domain-containing protein [Pseudomonas sp. CCC1.2]MEB0153589.1 DUF4225 domain-containing protein [Pseudomonas sp. CCC4.3]